MFIEIYVLFASANRFSGMIDTDIGLAKFVFQESTQLYKNGSWINVSESRLLGTIRGVKDFR